jgi:ribosomal-protein-alanine N-acetyltransferase
LVGAIELRIDDAAGGRGSIGYIVNPTHQGNGYATEATRLIIEFGLGPLRLRRIEATCDPCNAASAHVLKKAGLRREALLSGHRVIRGRRGDSVLFAVESAGPS